jgi:Family of unknown function (DUF5670)
MWLFDPSSPCIAIFKRYASNLRIFCSRGNLASLQGNLLQRRPAVRIKPTVESIAGPPTGERPMLWTITIILFILWVVGLVSSYTMGGWIHILLVLAIIVLIFNLLSGRRAI